MATKTWTGAADDNAANSANWTPTGAPQAGDTSEINSNASMNMVGGTLTGLLVGKTMPGNPSQGGNTITATIDLSQGATLGATVDPAEYSGATLNVVAAGDDTADLGVIGSQAVGTALNVTIGQGAILTAAIDAGRCADPMIAGPGDYNAEGVTQFTNTTATFTAAIIGNGTLLAGQGGIVIGSSMASTDTLEVAYNGAITIENPDEFSGSLSYQPGAQEGGFVVLNGITATSYTDDGSTLTLRDANGNTVDALKADAPASAISVSQDGSSVMIGLNDTPYQGTLLPDVPANATASIQDQTAGTTTSEVGNPYSGPVAGVQTDFADITTDTLDITAVTPNQWILAGESVSSAPSAELRINAAGGTNVLDGQDPSDFLVGGSGMNTFYLDDRNPTGPVWSTLANFHSGDNATIWGMTAQDFDIYWSANQGATGYTGATLHAFSKTGGPEASVTLSGYSTAALSNGQLSVTFGTIQGNAFMLLHAN